MLHNGMYMTDDEFLSNFHMDRLCIMKLNRLVVNDEVFRNVSGKMGKYLGSYRKEASLHKTGRMMGISKGAVNDYVKCASSAILKLCIQGI